jgi:hypothetical protein
MTIESGFTEYPPEELERGLLLLPAKERTPWIAISQIGVQRNGRVSCQSRATDSRPLPKRAAASVVLMLRT